MNRWRMLLLVGTALATVSFATSPKTDAQESSARRRESSALSHVTLTATVRELGTLGGARSSAADMDGNLVVGTSTTASGAQHAFVYDVSTSTMRDLGTLGGTTSEAVTVDGSVVVGNSTTATGARHAFAYDVAATTPSIKDLGTLGGFDSTAVDVDNGVVAGTSSTGSGWHAFAYDLAASSMRDLGDLGYYDWTWPTAIDGTTVVGTAGSSGTGDEHAFAYDLASATGMRDLGTLGFESSQAIDVDGDLVVGNSLTSTYQHGDTGRHAFAYDLGSSTRMRDLGDLGYDWSQASLVTGNRIVGVSRRSTGGSVHVFGYDFGPRPSSMRDLGNLGGDYITPRAATGSILVGRADRAGDQKDHIFAYDFGASPPTMTDLGPLGDLPSPVPIDGRPGDVAAAQGDEVAGTIVNSAGAPTAVLWTLRRTTAPAFRFSRFHYSVQENAGRAVVTVYRAGDTKPAVSVHYATRAVSATAGKDFLAGSGRLRFAAGQTRRTITVPVLNDPAREQAETVLLELSSPSSGSVLGTPNAAALDIRVSDQRPDAWISTQPSSGYVGNHVFNTTGKHQTRAQTGPRLHTRSFYVRVHNTGGATDTFTIRGSKPHAASVRYHTGRRDYLDWTRDVTRAMRSTTGWHVIVQPHSYVRIRVQITPGRTAPIGSRQVAAVTTTWRGDVTRSDQVKSVVATVR